MSMSTASPESDAVTADIHASVEIEIGARYDYNIFVTPRQTLFCFLSSYGSCSARYSSAERDRRLLGDSVVVLFSYSLRVGRIVFIPLRL